MFKRHFQADGSFCLVESKVIVCIVEPDTDGETQVFAFVSRYKASLAFIEALPDGRELVVFDRHRLLLK